MFRTKGPRRIGQAGGDQRKLVGNRTHWLHGEARSLESLPLTALMLRATRQHLRVLPANLVRWHELIVRYT